jgi:hypothetical protein
VWLTGTTSKRTRPVKPIVYRNGVLPPAWAIDGETGGDRDESRASGLLLAIVAMATAEPEDLTIFSAMQT